MLLSTVLPASRCGSPTASRFIIPHEHDRMVKEDYWNHSYNWGIIKPKTAAVEPAFIEPAVQLKPVSVPNVGGIVP